MYIHVLLLSVTYNAAKSYELFFLVLVLNRGISRCTSQWSFLELFQSTHSSQAPVFLYLTTRIIFMVKYAKCSRLLSSSCEMLYCLSTLPGMYMPLSARD